MNHPPVTCRVAVGWSSHRPIRPDEHTSLVVVEAATKSDCERVAAQMVGCRPQCKMVTRTTTLDLRI